MCNKYFDISFLKNQIIYSSYLTLVTVYTSFLITLCNMDTILFRKDISINNKYKIYSTSSTVYMLYYTIV